MLYALPLLSVLLLMLAAFAAFSSLNARPQQASLLCEWAGLSGFAVSLLCMAVLLLWGASSGPAIGIGEFALVSRIDALSVIMMLLVSFLGWVVLRYSCTYLDGEPGQARFMGWMSLTIAAILLLVQAGNLVLLAAAWIATSLALHRLLLFYANRPQAQRAARKKFLFARLSDIALIAAALVLVIAFGTGDIQTILAVAPVSENDALLYFAGALLAVAALLKSAQFPTHGWLTEVMETPTPVSALLHAGLINAGGFLLIRFADVMLQAPVVLAVLVLVGGFTALLGSVVMLTQSAVKSSLAWSTIAQMGFMIFQCGLALFPLGLLHLVAHSLYKAHAFLSAGNAVESVASIARPGPVAIPGARAVLRAFLLAVGIYVAVALVFGISGKSPQAIALGAILVFGVAYLLAQGFADKAPGALTQRTAVYALATAIAYFTLQEAADRLMRSTLPATPNPGLLEWALILLSLISFGAVALGQAMLPLWAHHPAVRGLRVHLSNGFYANSIFDRLLAGWSMKTKGVSR